MSRGTEFKEISEFPRRLKIFLAVVILLMVFGTISFKLLTGNTVKGSAFRALQTMAFMFDDESSIPERFLEIFLAIFGVFILWWVLWSIADMILDGNLAKYLKRELYSLRIKNMKGHTIIIGGGRMGAEIAKVLSCKKKNFLIVESDPKVAALIKHKRYIVIEGDALDEAVLKTAGVSTAFNIVLTLPKTESNIMVALASKEINPRIEVHARCDNPSLVSKLKKIGAKAVVVPEVVAADKIANDLG